MVVRFGRNPRRCEMGVLMPVLAPSLRKKMEIPTTDMPHGDWCYCSRCIENPKPAIHSETIEADPGDEIRWWGDFDWMNDKDLARRALDSE